MIAYDTVRFFRDTVRLVLGREQILSPKRCVFWKLTADHRLTSLLPRTMPGPGLIMRVKIDHVVITHKAFYRFLFSLLIARN